METINKTLISVYSTINAPVDKVWNYWSEPAHIKNWNHASDDWHSPSVENDLRVDGKFKINMAAKNGSYGFDFEGIYTKVEIHKLIEYTMLDNRKVKIYLIPEGNITQIVETFEAENTNSEELQKQGWQSILDNFKKYTESN